MNFWEPSKKGSLLFFQTESKEVYADAVLKITKLLEDLTPKYQVRIRREALDAFIKKRNEGVS